MKKQNKRDRTEYAGLEKSVNLKVRHELLDFDYLHKLTDKEKKWLSDFMREYAAADFQHTGRKMHRCDRTRKVIYDANNARNRDAFAVTKSNGMLKPLTKERRADESGQRIVVEVKENRSTVPNEMEDALIAAIDSKGRKKGVRS